MTIPLLTTKLYIPPPRPHLVPRPRLIQRLDEGLRLGHRLTLVSAPAGFGKTTLVTEWICAVPREVAWVSLDEGDNDPIQFLTYLIAALQQVNGNIGRTVQQLLRSPQVPSTQSLIASLINDFGVVVSALVLVLDDYHLITAPTIHGALQFLLDHQPPTMHLVVSTRQDPPLPLPRLRARNQVTEVRQRDLRFTAEEASAFLNETMGLHLSTEDVAALEARTEGWIAGLQLAALALHENEDDTQTFIAGFTGDDRYVVDYLVAEVLQRQPEETREFLRQTAILDRLNASLCDEVTGRHDSQTILEQLERANLFVVPVDNRRQWYRYHRLFADLLRARVEAAEPSRVPELHRRASTWFQGQGALDEAVKHAIAGGDLARVATIIETRGIQMLMRGELMTQMRWISSLPEQTIRSSPRICTTHGWALLLTGQMQRVEPRLQQAEATLPAQPADDLPGHIAAIRAYLAAQQGDAAHCIELADLALELLDEQNLGIRAVVHFVLGGAHMLCGDWVAAGQAFRKAGDVGQRGGNVHVAAPALNALAGIQTQQGHLRQAQRTAQEAIRLASDPSGRPLPFAAGPISALADLAYEWNDLDGALAYAQQSVELSRQWGSSDSLCAGYLTLARVLQGRGDLDGARDALLEAEQSCRDVTTGPTFPTQLRAARVRLWLARLAPSARGRPPSAQADSGDRGDLAAATRWVQEVEPAPLDPLHLDQSLTVARVDLATARWDAALENLTGVFEIARPRELTTIVIEALALQALAYMGQGAEERALAALGEALSLAEAEGYVRRFVDEGEPMRELLQLAAFHGYEPGYTGRLVAAFGSEEEAREKWMHPAAGGALLPSSSP